MKYILWALAAVAGILFMWYFSNIVIYVIVSVVIAIIGRPLVCIIKKIKIGKLRVPGSIAALLTLIVIWGVGVAFFALFIPLIFNKISGMANIDWQGLLTYFNEPIARIENFLQEYFAINTADISIPEIATKYVQRVFDTGTLNNFVSSIVSIVGSTVVAIGAVTFITFFFLKDETLFQRILIAILPAKHENKVNHMLHSTSRFLSRYFIGILCESTIMMLVVAIALICCGYPVPDAFFIGIIIGISNIIPYIGPWLGFALSLLVSMPLVATGMTFTFIFFTLGITVLCAQIADNFLLQPILYSNSVRAHPLEIFIVIIMGGTIAGVAGMLLAIPTYTVLRVIAKEFFNNFRIVNQLTENMGDIDG